MRRAWLLGCLCLAVAAAAGECDTLIMVDGLVMKGKVDEEGPDFLYVKVYDGAGRVRVPRARIRSIEYDYATKAASLKEDDYKGHYDLGVWAGQRGMYTEAVEQLEKAKGQEGAGADLPKLLGQAYDHLGNLKAAYDNYQAYLRDHPDDAAVAARAAEIGKTVAPGATPTPVTKADPTPKAPVSEGYETTFAWWADTWRDYNPCVVAKTASEKTGDQMLWVDITPATSGPPKDKASFCATCPKPLDLSAIQRFTCRIRHNGPREARVAVAFVNQDGEYYESREQMMPAAKWATFSVPVSGKDWKCAKTGWAYSSELGGRDAITRIVFLVYGQRPIGLWVNDISFRQD